MLTVEQIADGWKPHDGGKCPVDPDNVADALLRNGEPLSKSSWGEGYWIWSDKLPEIDIIAYKDQHHD